MIVGAIPCGRPQTKIMKTVLPAFLLFLISAVSSCAQDTKTYTLEDLIGDWRGESICVNKEKFPACKDEKVVYHIKKTDKADTVTIAANKIVNGAEEEMGEIDFVFDKEKQTLKGEFQNQRYHGSFEFEVKDGVISGHLFDLPARTIVRDISVKKK